jgi:hypothetical protein
MKHLLSLPILIYGLSAFAASSVELVETAYAVKAIYDQGKILPQIVDIQFAQQGTIPPKKCVMVIYERKPNTICPDHPIIGPNLDKGYAVCFNASTHEVESVIGVQTPDCNKEIRNERI